MMEVIRIHTAIGGGYGDPRPRPCDLLESDIKNGFVTIEQAIAHYGYQPG